MKENSEWSNIISSKAVFSWTTLNDVWHYRDLLWMFVRRDIVTNYKQTVLGPLWFFIQPALTTAMFVFIQRAAKIDTDGIHPVLFYLIGVTAWNYFAECLTKTSTTFKDNAFIFGKVYFPRLILPISIVASNLIRFFIQLLLFVIIMTGVQRISLPSEKSAIMQQKISGIISRLKNIWSKQKATTYTSTIRQKICLRGLIISIYFFSDCRIGVF